MLLCYQRFILVHIKEMKDFLERIGPLIPINILLSLLICLEMDLSSSPSNSSTPQDGPRFPDITLWDNINCQHKLLTEKLKS